MITVLRLGHRPDRDKRVTTHVCLVARAFGADKIILTTRDEKIRESVAGVVKRFGGSFELEFAASYKKIIRDFPGKVVHLTMYGEPYGTVAKAVGTEKDVLIVVGAEKVPGDVYDLAHYNASVGNQPHSEVAALALFLHRLLGDAGLEGHGGGEMKILPTGRGKRVVTTRTRAKGAARRDVGAGSPRRE
ncbi:MAG: tRNA (cytidine(56)-2'-O)-methyltransferase [Euryarchaeota archaeon]|nr:tRNA (cytidine(56)-2'-O)-methyltransferase [Euryarchaeota archaeon]